MVFLLCQIPKLSFYKIKINVVNNTFNTELMVMNSFSILKPGKMLSLIHSASYYDSFTMNIFLILNKKIIYFFLFFLIFNFFSFFFVLIVKPRRNSFQNGSDILTFKNRLIIPQKEGFLKIL